MIINNSDNIYSQEGDENNFVEILKIISNAANNLIF